MDPNTGHFLFFKLVCFLLQSDHSVHPSFPLAVFSSGCSFLSSDRCCCPSFLNTWFGSLCHCLNADPLLFSVHFLFLIWLFQCLCVCARMHLCAPSASEGQRGHQITWNTGVTDHCELYDAGAEKQSGVLCKNLTCPYCCEVPWPWFALLLEDALQFLCSYQFPSSLQRLLAPNNWLIDACWVHEGTWATQFYLTYPSLSLFQVFVQKPEVFFFLYVLTQTLFPYSGNLTSNQSLAVFGGRALR